MDSEKSCPKCGYAIGDPQSLECRHCGVIFAKVPTARARTESQPAISLSNSATVVSEEAAKDWKNRLRPFLVPLTFLFYFAIGDFLGIIHHGTSMVLHEFGHAYAAWCSGSPAIPLPLFTTVPEVKLSFSLLFAAAVIYLVYWSYSRKEVFVCAIAILTLLMTIYLHVFKSIDQRTEVHILWGVLGEIVFATVFVTSFYYRIEFIPDWSRARFLLLNWGALNLVSEWRFWRSVKVDIGRLPLGAAIHDGPGDLDRLMDNYGWDAYAIPTFLIKATLIGFAIIVAHQILLMIKPQVFDQE